MVGTIYLIPVTLGDTDIDRVLPAENKKIISTIKHFVVENIRTARRFLKKNDKNTDINALTFFELNKHTTPEEIHNYLHPLFRGHNLGIMSEAGCPAIADPGSQIVEIAHQKGIKVVPLVGPSSILLALMASGFNGQSFAFHGYLPIEVTKRKQRIKQLEQRIYSEEQTQIFIETPYRNNKLLKDLSTQCNKNTKICIAINITCPDEQIITLTVKEWMHRSINLDKKPCIFLVYK